MSSGSSGRSPRERRLRLLEEKRKALRSSSEAIGGGRKASDRLARKFMSGMLTAMAGIRRAPLDRHRGWGYSLSKLRNGSPFSIACHLAPLRALEHPDEDEAREILDELVLQDRLVDP